MIRATASLRKRLALTPVAFAATLAFLSGVGWAQDPIEGTYKSQDLGGPIEPGRNSISWSSPGGRVTVGNTVNVQSWSGSALGEQWSITCTTVSSPPVLVLDTVDSEGNGYKVWQVTHSGGFVWLGAGAPWDGGGAPYNGFVDHFVMMTSYQYSASKIVSAISNLSMEATIVGGVASCFSLTIANTVEVGSTDTGSKPADYPDFLDNNCETNATLGSWGDVTGATLSLINCTTVPTEKRTWGSIKQRYED